MNDVSMMNTVQQVAAKWVQSAQTAEAKEAQGVQNPLDFSENNVTMTNARKTITPRSNVQLDAPKGVVDTDNGVRLQQSVVSTANAFRSLGADQDQTFSMTEMQVDALPTEKRRQVDVALKAFTLIAESSEKRREAMTKDAAEIAKGKVTKAEKMVDKLKSERKDVAMKIVTGVIKAASGATSSIQPAVTNKKAKAVLGTFSVVGAQAGGITQGLDEKNNKEKAIEKSESRVKLEAIAGASAGVQALADEAEEINEMVRNARRDAKL